MLFILVINLYTSREVLVILGVEDYGIYSVVASFVMMFSFFNTAMATASSRYITYEQGLGDINRQIRVYSTTVMIHATIAIVVLILGEAFGVWYINNKMVLSESRHIAANYVFQAAILAFFFNIVSVPFISTVIAHEDMGIYAVVSVIDAALKLGIVFLLPVIHADHLVIYSILLLLVAIINYSIYLFYCKTKYFECHFKINRDVSFFKEMLSFAGWSFVGNFGISAKDYGVNLVLNLFFGPTVNAARAIAYQVSSAVNGFVSNFQLALNPQITKSYAVGQLDSVVAQVITGAKISFFLLSVIIIPVIVKSDYILSVWLVEVPDYTGIFMRLILLMALVNSMYGPISTAMLATGRIKTYQIVIAVIMFTDVPISYLALSLGAAPYSVFIIGILSALIALIVRLMLLNKVVMIGFGNFLTKVILKNIAIFVIMFSLPYLLSSYIPNSFIGLLIITSSSLAWSTLVVWCLGLNKEERRWFIAKARVLLKINAAV